MKGAIPVVLSLAVALTGCGGGASGDGTPGPSGGGASSGAGVTKSILYSFSNAPDGAVPDAALIRGADGNFYGTTASGGTHGDGTVFELTPAGTETILYSFAGGSDGSTPFASLIQGSDGNFYGTTAEGGANSVGTVFEVTPAGVETVLYSFAGKPDGAVPYAGVIQGSDGNFYGTTYYGGANNEGSAFEVTPAGIETVLYSFDASNPEPLAALVQGSDGNFYGTTLLGGTNHKGTVFELTPAGTETVLYSFAGGVDGDDPSAALIQGSDGNFYGSTASGGADNEGTVFEVTPAGAETVLYSFTGSSDGANPSSALVQGSDGNFYGTASDGGTGSQGTVFEVTPGGVATMLYSFGGEADGARPDAALVQGSDGSFYGTTSTGGADGVGSVFKIAVAHS